MEYLDQVLSNERAFMAVGIDVDLFSFIIFVTRLEINKVLATR